MYCPRCGQEQVNNETRFCSRCGFLMTGVTEIIANDGLIPEKYVRVKDAKNSPKKRGIKQGATLFLSGILIVPLIAIIFAGIYNTEGFIVAIAALLTFVAGILRMLYAVLFESGNPNENTLEENVLATSQKFLNKQKNKNALPPEQSIPTSAYEPPTAGNWRDTSDLEQSSVAEDTTKLLEQNQK
jgi:F0F1-type ATP synthase assembly protein I